MSNDDVDLDTVIREIEADARARRRSGVYPPAFERELDELFARFAPPAASGDLDALIDSAEEHGLIEPFIPVESQKPAGRVVKQGFAKALGWYHTWLTQEISQFAGAAVRALRVAADRLAAIERRLGNADEHAALLAVLPFVPPEPRVRARVVDRLRAQPGRVLVARAGDGQVVVDLRAAGLDAYGVEPDADAREVADELGVDLLPDDVASHLEAVSVAGLGAVVLAGPDVDAAPVGARIALLRTALGRLADGGVLVVVGTQAAALRQGQPIVADLAAAPPFTAPTWSAILTRLGASAVDVEVLGDAVVAHGVVAATGG